MKPNLSKIAILLSIIAIAISIAQPIDSYFRSVHEREMEELASKLKPQFSPSIGDLAVYHRYTTIYVANWGNATAHNVYVSLYFLAGDDWNTEIRSSQFVPEIQPKDSAMVTFPIGLTDLELAISESTGLNITNYEADVFIRCNEIETVESHYTYTQFSTETPW